jgi:hypothetical protein
MPVKIVHVIRAVREKKPIADKNEIKQKPQEGKK